MPSEGPHGLALARRPSLLRRRRRARSSCSTRTPASASTSLPLPGVPDVVMHDAEPAAPLRRDRRAGRRLQLRHRAARAPRDGRDRGRGAHDRLGSRWPPPVRLLPRQRRGRGVRGTRLSPDARRIVAGQGARALAYGLGSVLIGVTLAAPRSLRDRGRRRARRAAGRRRARLRPARPPRRPLRPPPLATGSSSSRWPRRHSLRAHRTGCRR